MEIPARAQRHTASIFALSSSFFSRARYFRVMSQLGMIQLLHDCPDIDAGAESLGFTALEFGLPFGL